MSERKNAKVRMQRLLKHFRNVLQTKAGDHTVDTVDDLLCDLHIYCSEKGIDLVERMTEASIATDLGGDLEREHTLTADELRKKYYDPNDRSGGEGEHPLYSKWDWCQKVAQRGTVLGYWEHVADLIANE